MSKTDDTRRKMAAREARTLVDVAGEIREAHARADGWPLCPSCGEDEVWSPLIVEDDAGYPRTPTLEECMEHGAFECLACGWRRPPEAGP